MALSLVDGAVEVPGGASIPSAQAALWVIQNSGSALQKIGAQVACNMFLAADALNGVDSQVDRKSCSVIPRPPLPRPQLRFRSCGMPGVGFGFASFQAGTLIETALGKKKIEEIAVGDIVAARDGFTGEINWRPVKELFRRTAPGIIHLTLEDSDGGRETLNVTSEHPFFVEGKGWVEVRRLERGDRVVSEKNGGLFVAHIALDDQATKVFNFEVEDDHNYFVGHWAAGDYPEFRV